MQKNKIELQKKIKIKNHTRLFQIQSCPNLAFFWAANSFDPNIDTQKMAEVWNETRNLPKDANKFRKQMQAWMQA